tara:strand:+ start:1049 stop:1348 length:300 start_codon:yes stop_codon:yes gene_type:complete
MKRENITNPGKDPVSGDWIKDTYDSGMIKEFQFYVAETPPLEERKTNARQWRDFELQQTDMFSLLTDHPQNAAYKTYRQKLRDWPSTSDFPDTKPTLDG